MPDCTAIYSDCWDLTISMLKILCTTFNEYQSSWNNAKSTKHHSQTTDSKHSRPFTGLLVLSTEVQRRHSGMTKLKQSTRINVRKTLQLIVNTQQTIKQKHSRQNLKKMIWTQMLSGQMALRNDIISPPLFKRRLETLSKYSSGALWLLFLCTVYKYSYLLTYVFSYTIIHWKCAVAAPVQQRSQVISRSKHPRARSPGCTFFLKKSWRPFFSRCPQNTKAANAAEIVSLSKTNKAVSSQIW